MSNRMLMLLSADINEEWRKRGKLNQSAETEISQALMVQSPGQIQVHLAEVERALESANKEITRLTALLPPV